MVDSDHTWRFEAADELTAANTVEETVGFNAPLAMRPRFATNKDSIESVTSVVVYPAASGLAVSGAEVSDNKQAIEVDGVITVAGSYTVVFTFVLVEGGTRVRRGMLHATTASGT